MKTQNAQILTALQSGAGLTSLDAQERYGIMRLAARILDLRGEGHNILSKRVEVTNRYGEKVRVARYWLAMKEAA
jgi:hypothetical protein